MVAANLNVSPIGGFVFLTASTPSGWPLDQVATFEEELTSPGVDGRRWRSDSLQHMPIFMQTVIDLASYDEAISIARKYRRCKGLIGNLSISISGTTHVYPKVHIAEAMPRCLPGRVSGAGAAASNAAFIVCDWVLFIVPIDLISTA